MVDKESELASFEVRYERELKEIDYQTKNKMKKQDFLMEEQKEIYRLKETYGENSQSVQDSEKLISHLHSVILRAEITLTSLTEEKNQLKDKQAECKKVLAVLKEKLKNFPIPERNLYDVDIPDDTGNNYLNWDSVITPDLQKRLGKMLIDNGFKSYFPTAYAKGEYGVSLYTENDYPYEPFAEFYNELSYALGSLKAASLALSKAGFRGIKVIANRNRGGNDKGIYNYIIFNEADAQITDHIKFSLNGKTILLQEDNGTIEMNYRSWQKEKDKVRDVLISDADLAEDEADTDTLIAQPNSVAESVKAFMEKSPRFVISKTCSQPADHLSVIMAITYLSTICFIRMGPLN